MSKHNDGRTTTIHRRVEGRASDFEADNRWVAPYNPLLSELFECHINVGIVFTIKPEKYLYKSVYKGHDRTQIRLEAQSRVPPQVPQGPVEHDEIAEYIDARYSCCVCLTGPHLSWHVRV